MESIPSSSTTSGNSAELNDFRGSSDWERLRNAVAEPVREMIAVEIDSAARGKDIIRDLLALSPSRPNCVLEFAATTIEAASLLTRAREVVTAWPDEEGLLLLLDVSSPRSVEEDVPATAFWQGMNLLREQWDSLNCQKIFFLLPYNYRLLSSTADHLKRWMSLKVHLLSVGGRGGGMESKSAESSETDLGLRNAPAARQALATLEAQLREAIRRDEPPATLIRRYYLPMFAAAVSVGDLPRAQRVRKKIEAVEIPEGDLPDWLNLNFKFEMDQYRLSSALAVAERHLQWAQKARRPEQEAVAYFNLGRVAQERRDFANAERWFQKSLAIGEQPGNGSGAASTYHQLGRLAQEQRDFAAAEDWYRKSLAIEEQLGNEDGVALTYHQLGRVAHERRDFAAAERWYQKALAILEKMGDEYSTGIAYHQLGVVAQEQRDFTLAERWYRRSLAIAERMGNERSAATSFHQLGRIAEEQRDFTAAERWYQKALAITEKLGDEHGSAMTYHQLGMIAQEQKDLTAALRWYQKALTIEEKHGDEHLAAMTYHQLGVVSQENRDFATAEHWYQKSVAVEEKQGNEHGAAITYHQLGRVAQERRDFAAAERWYQKALAITEKQDNEQTAAGTCHQLGTLAWERGDYEQAGSFILRAYAHFTSYHDQHNARICVDNFSNLLRVAPQEIREKLRGIGRAALGEELMRQVERS